MSEQHPQTEADRRPSENRWFSFFYRTRIKVSKQDLTIVNLSLAFSLLTAVSAPWLAVAGLVIALALGYRIDVERNAPGFSGSFREVTRDAAQNVKTAVDQAVRDEDEPQN